jgi:hypothetical protein
MPRAAPMRRDPRSWICGGVLLEVDCCNCMSHLASLGGKHVFITDCNKLKVMALGWPSVAYRSCRVS